MSCFDDVTITWDEKEYVIKSNMVMGLIESIESVVTLEEINDMLNNKRIVRSQIARAYCAALNYGGANTTAEKVYNHFFGDGAFVETINTLVALMAMMIPPEHLRSKQNPKPISQEDGDS